MKRSQIALLSVGGILAGIVIVSVVSARIALSHGGTEFLDTRIHRRRRRAARV